MKTTVYCYDRFATAKRFGAAGGLLLLGAGAFLAIGLSQSARAATPRIERLPTVIVTGKAAKADKPEQLPRVVVEGRRQPGVVVASSREAGDLKKVAYVPNSAGY